MNTIEKILEYIFCIFIALGIMTVFISILCLFSVTYGLDKLEIINVLPL